MNNWSYTVSSAPSSKGNTFQKAYYESYDEARARIMRELDEKKRRSMPASRQVIDLSKDEYQVLEPDNTQALVKTK